MAHRFLPLALVAALTAVLVAPRAGAQTPVPDAPLESHVREATTASGSMQHVFGITPALASTPFFGLALLSGTALLADTSFGQSYLPASLTRNRLVAEARRYSSLPVFGGLLVLSVIGYLANSGKLQGVAGKGFRVVEDSSVLVTYTLLALIAVSSAAGASAARPALLTVPVHEAGMVDGDVLLALLSACSLATLLTVRLAFDVLVWLSPIPFVDLVFETTKKFFTVGFVMLYIVSPLLATLCALLILLIGLFVLGWAVRLLRFLRGVLLGPAFSGLFGRPPRLLVDPAAREQKPEGQGLIAIEAFAAKVPGVPTRKRGHIVATGEGARFLYRHHLRPNDLPLAASDQSITIGTALAWIEVRVLGASGRTHALYLLPRTYLASVPAIRRALNAVNVGSVGTVRALDEGSSWFRRLWKRRREPAT